MSYQVPPLPTITPIIQTQSQNIQDTINRIEGLAKSGLHAINGDFPAIQKDAPPVVSGITSGIAADVSAGVNDVIKNIEDTVSADFTAGTGPVIEFFRDFGIRLLLVIIMLIALDNLFKPDYSAIAGHIAKASELSEAAA